VFDFYGQTFVKRAIQVSERIAKSNCEDSYRTGADIVHGGRGQIIFWNPFQPCSLWFLEKFVTWSKIQVPISLLLQVLLA